jgi:hypothetical protein
MSIIQLRGTILAFEPPGQFFNLLIAQTGWVAEHPGRAAHALQHAVLVDPSLLAGLRPGQHLRLDWERDHLSLLAVHRFSRCLWRAPQLETRPAYLANVLYQATDQRRYPSLRYLVWGLSDRSSAAVVASMGSPLPPPGVPIETVVQRIDLEGRRETVWNLPSAEPEFEDADAARALDLTLVNHSSERYDGSMREITRLSPPPSDPPTGPVPLRLLVFSDLHIDLVGGPARQRQLVAELAELIGAAAPDVLVFAGDLSNSLEPVSRTLRPLALGRLGNLLVPGNHDAWLSEPELRNGSSSPAHLARLRGLVEGAGWSWLPGQPRQLGGWGFAGTLGWYDRSYADPSLGASTEMYRRGTFGGTRWNDMPFARFTDPAGIRLDDPEVFARYLAEMRADLANLGLAPDGAGPPTVAVSHTLPYRALLVERPWDRGWTYCQAFMGGAGLGALYDSLPAIRLVAAGHTHIPRDIEGGDGRRYVVSPIGYEQLGEWAADLRERLALFELAADGQITRLAWPD